VAVTRPWCNWQQLASRRALAALRLPPSSCRGTPCQLQMLLQKIHYICWRCQLYRQRVDFEFSIIRPPLERLIFRFFCPDAPDRPRRGMEAIFLHSTLSAPSFFPDASPAWRRVTNCGQACHRAIAICDSEPNSKIEVRQVLENVLGIAYRQQRPVRMVRWPSVLHYVSWCMGHQLAIACTAGL
jgi:hypothetical protein